MLILTNRNVLKPSRKNNKKSVEFYDFNLMLFKIF